MSNYVNSYPSLDGFQNKVQSSSANSTDIQASEQTNKIVQQVSQQIKEQVSKQKSKPKSIEVKSKGAFRVIHMNAPENLDKKTIQTLHGDFNQILTSDQCKKPQVNCQSNFIASNNQTVIDSDDTQSEKIQTLIDFIFSKELYSILSNENITLKSSSSEQLSIHVMKDGLEVILSGYFNFKSKKLVRRKQAFLYIVTKQKEISFHKPERSHFFTCVDQIDQKYLSASGLAFKDTSKKMVCVDRKNNIQINYDIGELIRSDESIANIAENKHPDVVDKILDSPFKFIGEENKTEIYTHALDFELDEYEGQDIKNGDAQPLVFTSPAHCNKSNELTNFKDCRRSYFIQKCWIISILALTLGGSFAAMTATSLVWSSWALSFVFISWLFCIIVLPPLLCFLINSLYEQLHREFLVSNHDFES